MRHNRISEPLENHPALGKGEPSQRRTPNLPSKAQRAPQIQSDSTCLGDGLLGGGVVEQSCLPMTCKCPKES